MTDKDDKTAPRKKAAAKKKSAKASPASSMPDDKPVKVGGGTRTHPVTAERLKQAEDVIRKKKPAKDTTGGATSALKQRAHEAKLRAQEKILNKSYVSDPVDPLERLADTFDNSSRRWAMVIYPLMFAFVLLSSFGFYLIYNLTHDISELSKSVTHMAEIVSDSMPEMTSDVKGMTGSINSMTANMDHMTGNMSDMSDQMQTLRPMNANLANMTQTMGSMNRSVYGMQRDVGNMNRTVSSGPFGFMNDVMPFSSNSYSPARAAPPPIFAPPAMAPPPTQKLVKPNSSPQIQNQPPAVVNKKP